MIVASCSNVVQHRYVASSWIFLGGQAQTWATILVRLSRQWYGFKPNIACFLFSLIAYVLSGLKVPARKLWGRATRTATT